MGDAGSGHFIAPLSEFTAENCRFLPILDQKLVENRGNPDASQPGPQNHPGEPQTDQNRGFLAFPSRHKLAGLRESAGCRPECGAGMLNLDGPEKPSKIAGFAIIEASKPGTLSPENRKRYGRPRFYPRFYPVLPPGSPGFTPGFTPVLLHFQAIRLPLARTATKTI